MTGFYGLHRYDPGAPMPRHRHAEPYIAVVIEGGYLEAGDSGRIEARPGDVLLHGAYDAHRDHFERRGALVLNLPLEEGCPTGFGRIEDVDEIIRSAQTDVWEAAQEVRASMSSGPRLLGDWPDLLAKALNQDPSLGISRWADQMGLLPASVSRGFARAYGISPKKFRLECRVRRAMRQLRSWPGTLAGLSAASGFADQAHMCRAVAEMTTLSPAKLRAKSVQSPAA